MTGSIQLRQYLWLRANGTGREQAADRVGFSAEEARLTDLSADRGEMAEIVPLDPDPPLMKFPKRRKKMAAEASAKCRHCNGWAFEPDHYPMKVCTECNGTGRPPAKQAALQAAA